MLINMKKKIVKTLKYLFWSVRSVVSSGSVQKRLGYNRTAKLLIIHADDMGFSMSENMATIEAMGNGAVNSGSVMVPCPGFESIAEHLKRHSSIDAGVHLTLTGEWSSYRLKPVLPAEKVPTLVDQNGYLFLSKGEFSAKASPEDVEKECMAQIIKAIEGGINVTHIDSHMYTTFSRDDILRKYISLGKEFRLPTLLTREMPVWVRQLKEIAIVDRLYCAEEKDFNNGLDKYYTNVLKSLKPGLNCLLVHVAYNDSEMQNITHGKTGFGSEWRQQDFDFFTSDECKRLIKEKNIKMVTWREIQDKIMK
jgi:chitin disaccharide deacetylase